MLEVQQDTWHDTRTSWGRWNSYSEHTHTHTGAHTHSSPQDSGEAKPSSFQHYASANCQRWRLLFYNDDQVLQSTTLLSFFLLLGSLFAKWQKAFYYPTFLFQFVLFDICCPLYFPDPSLNSTRPFNAVDKWWVAGLCSGTSWHSARCWRNTYPHSPTSNSFSGIDARQHHGQIILSQGKLPIVHAVKQDETWNMLAHNAAVWISVTIFPLTCSHFLSL